LVDDADATAQRTTLGLGNVNNTSDANKPVSTAQQTALDLKSNILQPFSSIVSAAMTDLGSLSTEHVTITGTTTITSFGTAAAGTFRRVVFSGALTLTHNATSLILPQGGNVTTAAGHTLEAVSLGSGNWRVTSYQRTGNSGLYTSIALSPVTLTAAAFTDIPSWVKRITLSWENISTTGTTGVAIQIGPNSGPETTGYLCAMSNGTGSTTQFPVTNGSSAAAGVVHGMAVITLINSNTWAFSSQGSRTDVAAWFGCVGSITLSGTLSQVHLKTGNGIETFDNGSVNILYE
jgi:hypothetical protein